MSPSTRRWSLALGAVLLVTMALALVGGSGFTSRREAWPLEARLARGARSFLIPGEVKELVNPVSSDREVVRDGMEHFADHCAICHANDGSGDTQMGRALFPPAPDMRGLPTQAMSDGELFYVIEFGVPLTGMPAWGNGTPDGERASWELVRFIRHLPDLTAEEVEEMEALNPRSPAGDARSQEIADFLEGRGAGR
ncbi:MAG: cytochrome c [Longimicrobiales bacterium]